MYVQSSPHFGARLVVTITGNTYGCVRTPTRVAIYRPMTTRHTPPSRMDTQKARDPTARPTARSDEWMTAARVDLARASSTFGRPVASLYPASTRSIHEVRESDTSIIFLRARSRPSRARTRRRASVSRRRGWMDGWVEIISAGRAERGVRMDGMDDDRVARSRARMNERVDVIFLRVIREETSSRARLGARTRRDHDVPFIPSSVGRSIH